MSWAVGVRVGVAGGWLALALSGAAGEPLSTSPEALDNNSAFVRSKLQIAYEHQRDNAGRTDLVRLTGAKTFGERDQFGVLATLPFMRFDGPQTSVAGPGDLTVKGSWTFHQAGRFAQAIAFAVELATASHRPELGGAATLLIPQYAFNYLISETFSFTGQITYVRGVNPMPFVDISTLTIEPIVTARLPEGWYVTIDPKLSWALTHNDRPQPQLRYTLGRLFGARQEWNTAIYGQSALNQAAAQAVFRQMFGLSLARLF